VQTDIKRVLAYSTISQLGYMMLGMGVGAWIAALFHLLTHAFFKALMFLGSGQVIEGCHHEQDMRKMGGLIRKMPVTAITFLVGVFAIAGVGIPAVWMPSHLPFGLGGYFSKDEILAVAWSRVFGHEHAGLSPWLFWIPIAMAYVTPFYMMRCWWLTFMGQPRDPHVYEHAHESKLMYLPLVVLAAGTIVSSYLLFRPLVAAAAPQPFLTQAFDGEATEIAEAHGVMVGRHAHAALAPIVGGAFLVGFVLAWLIYRRGLAVADRLAQALKPLHTVLVHKFYFDELYGLVLIGGTMALKGICYLFDKYVVDGLVNLSAYVTERLSAFSGIVLDQGVVDGAVNGVGRTAWGLGGLARSPQVGRIRNYILFAAGGVAIVVLWMAFG
jgi:NADH-quinone oxidoreductase subunit L